MLRTKTCTSGSTAVERPFVPVPVDEAFIDEVPLLDAGLESTELRDGAKVKKK